MSPTVLVRNLLVSLTLLGCLSLPTIIFGKNYSPLAIRLFATLDLSADQQQQLEAAEQQLFLPPCSVGADVIGGRVFGDFNYDGADDQISGINGVKVYLFGCDQTDGSSVLLDSVTTDPFGDYSFTGLTGTNYRVEFLVPEYLDYFNGPLGTDNGTQVQFVSPGTCDVNASYTHPNDFCADEPSLIAACYINGDPLAPGAEQADQDILVRFPWTPPTTGFIPPPEHLVTGVEGGSIYGMDYDRVGRQVYFSAFAKRHVGMGPLGPGGIYQMDNTNPAAINFTPLVDLETIGIDVGNILSNSARGLPDTLDGPSNDADVYPKITTQSLGGLAFNQQDGRVYVVNLFDNTLIALTPDSDGNPATAPTAADAEVLTIPDPGCANGVWRPFAVSYHRGAIYVGGICDASNGGTEADLFAYVYKMENGIWDTNPVLDFSLDYTRGYVANSGGTSGTTCADEGDWYPWLTGNTMPTICNPGSNTEFVVYPQPVFSEIQFDIDGTMIIALMDRTGHQFGYRNYPLVGEMPLITGASGGDVLRATPSVNGFSIEQNGTANGLTTAGAGNNQGPGGGEFYFEDVYQFLGTTPHAETSLGGIATYPGSGEVATTAFDPFDTQFFAGGANWFSNYDGRVRDPGYSVYQTTSNNPDGTFGKANGMGDIVALCSGLPDLEIGGAIWFDENTNGVQDACESYIAGVNVSLYDAAGTLVTTTSSDGDGNYAFNQGGVPGGALTPGTDYFLVFGENGQFDPTTGLFNGNRYLSTNDVGMYPLPDRNDSDATLAPSGGATGNFAPFPYIPLTTGVMGSVDHSYDVAFTQDPMNIIANITGTVFNDADGNGLQDDNMGGFEVVTVILTSNGMPLDTVTTDSNGDFIFTNVSAGDYTLIFQTETTGLELTNSPQDVGGDDSIDSDPDPTTSTFTITGFDPDNGDVVVDLGVMEATADISGFTFVDDNENGVFDAGDSPLGNVTVNLYDANDLTVVLQTITTTGGGLYVFSGLSSGDYVIGFDPTGNDNNVPNYVFTQADQGGDDTADSDANPNTGLTGTITLDATAGGSANNDAGFIEPSAGISGYAFVDTNENGLQDAGDLDLSGVTVNLLDADNGNAVVATMTTMANGLYNFTDVLLGNYVIQFDATTNTGGLQNPQGSPQDVGGDDTIDSDPDPSSGLTGTINFDPANGTLMNVDAGYFELTAGLNGFVFNDFDQDGQQDGNETGVADVTVTLLNDQNAAVASFVTGTDGLYNFDNVQQGDYTLVFDYGTTNNTDYTFTSPNTGPEATDSDAIPITGTTTADVSFSFDPTTGPFVFDAGLVLPFAAVGDFVFLDCDNDGLQGGATDQPLANVSVTIDGTTAGGNTYTETATTGTDGAYLFGAVPAGTYTLQFTAPNGLTPTLQGAGPDATDSDIDANGLTTAFTVSGGSSNLDFDAGFADTTAPTFDQQPQDDTFGCTDGAGAAPVLTATDNFDADVLVTMTADTTAVMNGGGTCDGVAITRTYTASDDCGNQATFSYTVTLIDQSAPIFTTAPADTTVNCGILPDSEFKVIDDCDVDVEVTTETESFPGCPSIVERTYTATDDCGNTTTYVQTITQVDTVPPVITFVNPDLVGLMDGDTLEFGCLDQLALYGVEDAVATDDCSGVDTLIFQDLLVEDGDCIEDGFIRLMLCAWTAVDECGNESTVTIYFLVDDNEAPILSGVPPADITVGCNEVPPVPDVTATDNCTDDLTIEFSEVFLGDTCTGYKLIRKWTVEDDCGNMSMDQYSILVEIDSLQILGVPSDLTVDCSMIPDPPAVTADSDCFNPTIEFEEIIENDTCSDYKIIRVFTATDDCGRTEQEQYTITVTVPPLELTGVPQDITIDCIQPVPDPVTPQATSDCYDVDIEFTEMTNGDLCTDYQIVRMWRATSSCGEVVVETQVITVEVPELQLPPIPDDLTLDCSDPVPAPETIQPPTTCYDIDLDFVQDSVPGDCPQAYTLTRTYTATDECGNMVSDQQVITVTDTEAPVITPVDPFLTGLMNGDSIVVECDALPNLGEDAVAYTDNCDDNPTTDFMEMTDLGDCPEDGYIVRMECCWKAVDACGNEAEFCIIVRIEDNVDPEFDQPVPADLTVELAQGDTIPAAAILTASDDCAGAVPVEFMETSTANDCGVNIVRTWMAEDDCGNMVTATQTITVNDICDCPDIAVDSYDVTPAGCNDGTFGSVTANVALDPAAYDYLLIPNLGTQNADGNSFSDLPVGNYLLVVSLPNAPDCDEKFFFDIVPDCTDLLEVTISEQTEICLEDYPGILDFSGTLISSTIETAGNALQVSATAIDETCVTLTPASGFLGTATEQITVVHCYFDGNCDTTNISVTVDNICNLSLDVQTSPADCGEANGSVSLNPTGANGTLTYSWLPNIGSVGSFDDLPTGSYSYTVTDGGNCEVTGSISIDELGAEPFVTGEVSATTVSCPGAQDGSIVSNTSENYEVYQNGTLLGNTPLSGLAGGTYEVVKGTDDCTSSTTVEVEEAPAFEVNSATMPETCTGGNGIISLSVMGGTGSYTFAWSNGSTTNPVTNLSADEVYTVTITDEVGCTSVLGDLSVTLDCTPCDIDVNAAVTDATCAGGNDGSITLTPATLLFSWEHDDMLDGNVATGLEDGSYVITVTNPLLDCDTIITVVVSEPDVLVAAADVTNTTCAGNDGAITLGAAGGTPPYNFTWSDAAQSGEEAIGLAAGYTVSVTISDANGCTNVLQNITVEDGCTDQPCVDFISTSSDLTQADDCDGTASYCVDISFSEALSLDVRDNGMPFTNLQGCNFDTTLSYSIFSLPDGPPSAVYRVDSWTVNGEVFTGLFTTPQSLVDSMNVWDATATWMLSGNQNISGGNPSTSYGTIFVTLLDDMSTATLELNTNLIPNGTRITLAVGVHELTFTDPNSGCSDTLSVNVVCTTTDQLTDEIMVDGSGVLCPDDLATDELTGPVFSFDYFCTDCDEVTLTEDADGCLEYFGDQEGTVTITVVLCDLNGICDTTLLTVNVVQQLAPEADIDNLTVDMNTSGVVNVLENDRANGTLVSLTITSPAENGNATVNDDFTITYRPDGDYCGGDAFSYEICNQFGCAETTVNVQVLCDEPIPFTGFSPNGDGINDGFVIRGIEQFPDNTLTIYSRQGLEVYQKLHYDNSWKGVYRRSIDLPDGTYFYVLEYLDGTTRKTISGYVQLRR